jgi:hypothetical protein
MTACRGSIRRFVDRLPEGLVDAAWLWFVLRIGLGLIAVFLVLKDAVPGPCNSDLVINGWTTFPPLDDQGIAFPLVGVWQHWDACWYSKIAAYGYEAGTSSTNFFPLLPFLMGAGSFFLGGDVALAGLAVNAVAFVLALTGLRQLVGEDFDGPTAERTVLYVAVFPVAFFFFAPFTEALFLAGAVWAVVGARRHHWELAAVAGLLAGLTRPQGLLLVLPIGWEAAMALRETWRAGVPGPQRLGWQDLKPVVALATPAVAYVGYVAYTAIILHQPYFDAHTTWATTAPHVPWDAIGQAWDWAFERRDPFTMLNVAALLGFTVLAIAGLRLVPVSYSLYVLPQLALTLTQQTVSPLMSTARYLLVLFPCFVVLALAGRRPRFHTAWLLLSVLFLGLMTALFLEGNFVG